MNSVNLIGRLVKDVELKYSSNQIPTVRNVIAIRRNVNTTDFINITAFNKTAEIMAKYCQKGTKIGIQGHIITGQFEKNGKNTYTFDVVINSVEFLSKTKQINTETESEESQEISDESDELPW